MGKYCGFYSELGVQATSVYGYVLLYVCGALNDVSRRSRDIGKRHGAGESIFH
jgi:hypothetical protein